MESDSSAKSLLSLFSSSKLETFNPAASRVFYKGTRSNTPTMNVDPDPDQNPPRKKQRRSTNSREWTCAEIRALASYRHLMRGPEIDNRLREVLLPNRTEEEVRLQLARVDKTIRERYGGKLRDLQDEENLRFAEEEELRAVEVEKDYKRRRKGMDDILGLDERRTAEFSAIDHVESPQCRDGETVKASLDLVLGLVEESTEQRRKRELDQALGLSEK